MVFAVKELSLTYRVLFVSSRTGARTFYSTSCTVLLVKDAFQDALKADARSAEDAADVYRTTAQINERLLEVGAGVMGAGVTTREAAHRPQEKIMLPVRKPMKGSALVVAYQYIKRAASHFNRSITTASVSTWVKCMHALKSIGTWSSPAASSTRRQLNLSPAEALNELRDDAFVRNSYGRIAFLDALTAVIEEVGGTETIVVWTGPNQAARVIRCVYAQAVNFLFRVRTSSVFATFSLCCICSCCALSGVFYAGCFFRGLDADCVAMFPRGWCFVPDALICLFSFWPLVFLSLNGCRFVTTFATARGCPHSCKAPAL